MTEWTMIARRPVRACGRAVGAGERFAVGLLEGLALRAQGLAEFIGGREYPRRRAVPAPPVTPAAADPDPDPGGIVADGPRRPRRYRRRDLEAE